MQWRNDPKCRWGQMLETSPFPKRNFMSSYLKQLLGRVCFEELFFPWFIRYHVYIICDYAIILPVRVFSSSSSQPDLSCFESRELIDHMGEVSCLSKTSFDRQKSKTRQPLCPMVERRYVLMRFSFEKLLSHDATLTHMASVFAFDELSSVLLLPSV